VTQMGAAKQGWRAMILRAVLVAAAACAAVSANAQDYPSRTIRIIGFGPHFEDGFYEQNGHIRVDLGTDTAFLQEDVDLDEFGDEIESWVIDELKRIGLDSAKSVLALNKEELVRRTDLEEETVEGLLNVLKKEFE